MPEDGSRTDSSDIGKPLGDHASTPVGLTPNPQKTLHGNDAQVAVALMAASVFQTFENNYESALTSIAQQQVKASDQSTKEFLSHLNLLQTRDARRILEIVWKETGNVSEAALRAANKLKVFESGKLNCNSLAKALCAECTLDYDLVNSIKMLVVRVVDAGQFFNLIEKMPPSGKSIPLRATPVLDELMVTCHATNGLEIHSLIGIPSDGGEK